MSEQGEAKRVLLPELVFGPAQGRQSTDLQIEVVRELEDGDLVDGALPAPLPSAPPGLKALRHSHHRLAQLIAKGHALHEVALITGYDPEYVSGLKSDPAFRQLLAHYEGQRELLFVDVIERMRAVGLDSLEEIQQRLREAPERWSNREIMELTQMLLGGSRTGAGVGGGGVAVSVDVKFVNVPGSEASPGPVYDMEPANAEHASD